MPENSVARWYSPRGRLSEDELIGVYTDLTFAMLGRPHAVEPLRSHDAGVTTLAALALRECTRHTWKSPGQIHAVA
jgi:hypothetical protein